MSIAAIKEKITAYESKYGREPGSVTLLAASKKQSAAKIEHAYYSGQRIFGENYVQEALQKMAMLTHLNIEWHFIGPVQSNKTRKIAEHFNWVQSVCSVKIAERLNEQRPAHLPPLNICLEINLNAEPTKSGVAPSDIESLATICRSLPRLTLRGIMAIPAPTTSFALARQQFHAMQQHFQRLRDKGFKLDTLSIGMSDDFEAAIAEGATLVRMGSAIFGIRS